MATGQSSHSAGPSGPGQSITSQQRCLWVKRQDTREEKRQAGVEDANTFLHLKNPFLADFVNAQTYIIAGAVLIGNHDVILNEALSLLLK